MKKYKVATGVFLVLALFNLLFPPIYRPETKLLSDRKVYFQFIFDPLVSYEIDVKGLIILFIIALVISVLAQFVYNIIQEKRGNKTI